MNCRDCSRSASRCGRSRASDRWRGRAPVIEAVSGAIGPRDHDRCFAYDAPLDPAATVTRLPTTKDMETFIIDVPVPSMGATVSQLNVIVVKVQPGDKVAKGQRLGDLESDKSTFEFESPCD